jgi:hypothetical protein
MMSLYGGSVAAGSAVAVLQSVGAAGMGAVAMSVVAAGGGVVGAAAGAVAGRLGTAMTGQRSTVDAEQEESQEGTRKMSAATAMDRKCVRKLTSGGEKTIPEKNEKFLKSKY